MKRLSACLLVLVMGLALGAAPPKGTDAPDIVIPVPLPPTPPPPPAPGVLKLPSDVLWVASSDGPFVIDAVPEGLVSLTWEAGPLRVRGRFVEAPDRVQTRTFTGKHICTIEAIKSGRVELLIRPDVAGAKARRQCLDVVVGPPAPPDPGPKPPEPTPPGPVAKLKVLIVEETADRGKLPAAQLAVIFDKGVRSYLESKCPPHPTLPGRKEWNIWDKDTDAVAMGKFWQDMLARPRTSLPWIIIANDTAPVHEGPLPANAAETLALLKRFGG